MAETAAQMKARRDKARQIMRNRRDTGEGGWLGLCLKSVRTALGLPGGAVSAKAAWEALGGATGEHTHSRSIPPAGVPGFTDKPSGSRYGHVVLVDKPGKTIRETVVWSVDIKRRGKIDRVTIGYIEDNWGHRWLGWSEVLNGVRVHPPVD